MRRIAIICGVLLLAGYAYIFQPVPPPDGYWRYRSVDFENIGTMYHHNEVFVYLGSDQKWDVHISQAQPR